jgi:hypothetical protein
MNICVATAQSIVIGSTSVPQAASFGSRIGDDCVGAPGRACAAAGVSEASAGNVTRG